MILCLDGPYGVGKTTIANRIKEKFINNDLIILESDYYYQKWIQDNWTQGDSLLFLLDGTMPQNNQRFVSMFRDVIKETASNPNQLIISDMALTDDVSRKGIIDELCSEGYDVKHIILTADKDTILERIENDKNRDQSFAHQWLPVQLSYLENIDATKVETEGRSIDDIADLIISIIQE